MIFQPTSKIVRIPGLLSLCIPQCINLANYWIYSQFSPIVYFWQPIQFRTFYTASYEGCRTSAGELLYIRGRSSALHCVLKRVTNLSFHGLIKSSKAPLILFISYKCMIRLWSFFERGLSLKG